LVPTAVPLRGEPARLRAPGREQGTDARRAEGEARSAPDSAELAELASGPALRPDDQDEPPRIAPARERLHGYTELLRQTHADGREPPPRIGDEAQRRDGQAGELERLTMLDP